VEWGVEVCAGRWYVLAVCVEAVDAVLYFGEDATGGIQLTDSHSRRYHLQNVEGGLGGGAVSGEIQASQTGEMRRFIRV
jgi:hypothetical protein